MLITQNLIRLSIYWILVYRGKFGEESLYGYLLNEPIH